MTSKTAPPSLRVAVVAALVGCAVTALRVLAMQGFSNDHFFYLSRAAQLLHGARPVRDFVDPGFPLAIAASAVAQRLEPTLFSEALLVAAAFGLSAAITMWVMHRWLGSLALALWAAFVQVAVLPRSYSYPKVLMYAIGVWAFLWWTRSRTRAAAAGLGVVTGLAFLFRHDHGLWLGLGSLVLLAGGPVWRTRGALSSRLWPFFAGVCVLVAPHLFWVQTQGGIGAYFADGVSFSEREAQRTLLALPALNAPAWSPDGLGVLAYYALWLAPIVASALLWARRRAVADAWLVVAVITLAACANVGFLRDPLAYRVSDAVVPFTCVLAWAAASTWEAGRTGSMWLRRGVVTGILVAVAVAAARIGDLEQALDRAQMLRWTPRPLTRWHNVVAELRQPYKDDQMPSDIALALVPFDRYVQVCTPETARVLVTGFAPEVAYYARRGFAGGHPSLYRGYYASDAEQRRIVDRLRREQVLFVVETAEGAEPFGTSFPLVQDYLRGRFTALATLSVDGSPPVHIFINSAIPNAPIDPQTGWPCPGPRL